jgi:hypothetical protein
MPRCEGRPADGRCPDNKADNTVHLSQGDLMLCDACEEFRFPSVASSVAQASKQRQSKKTIEGRNTPTTTPTVAAAVLNTTTSSNASGSTASDATKQSSASSATASDRRATARSKSANEGADKSKATDGATSRQPPQLTDTGPELVINELLAYAGYYRNKSTTQDLRQTVLSSFTPSDISAAKRTLVQSFLQALEHCTSTADRRDSQTRPAYEAEVDDILDIFHLLDAIPTVLSGITFVAADLDALPKFGPGELNIAAVVDRQTRTEAAVAQLSATLQKMIPGTSYGDARGPSHHDESGLQTSISDLQNRLDSFASSVNSRLDHLNTVCTTSLHTNTSSPTTATHHSVVVDRNLNIVIFGVRENNEALIWRRSVNDILEFVTGSHVDVIDMFRLGRYNADRTRPVLVKLRVMWDRRLILSRRGRLRNFTQKGIFIEPDEPLEVRRRNALERIKQRAEQDGRVVTVTDGVLSIDGVIKFSLADGFIRNDSGSNTQTNHNG